MFIYKKNQDMRLLLDKLAQNGQKIGFVPTMGALHEGHLSLIASAKKKCDFVVTSIFVNPTQFNEQSDLDKYPRTLENDIQLLAQAGNNLLFTPTNKDIYPANFNHNKVYQLDGLDTLLEGAFRDGHFNGVAMVVHRLLDIVKPDAIFMGQKDYQQVAIIRQLIKSEKIPTKLVMCPIIRSPKGLALSSRNARLTPEWKKKALILSETLNFAKAAIQSNLSIKVIETEAILKIKEQGLKPEYFNIINGITLKKATRKQANLVAVTAAWAGDVRLIDNCVF